MTATDRYSPVAPQVATPARPRGRWLRQSRAILRRNLLQVKGDPLQALDIVMPMVLGVIFISVFGGAIRRNGGTNYTQYLLPGIMIQAISIVSVTTGISLNLDFSTGMMDRFRSLPIARMSVLIGRVAADVCRMAAALVLVFAFSLAIGFRVKGGLVAALGALLLVLAFGIALAWISAFIGLAIRSPQTVQSIGYVWLVPLQFGSSLFVPTDTLPHWLQGLVGFNPMTLICDAVRNLMLGADAARPLAGALAWIVGVTVVFAAAAVRQYARRV
jgi:oleandomycin transport system permease protein